MLIQTELWWLLQLLQYQICGTTGWRPEIRASSGTCGEQVIHQHGQPQQDLSSSRPGVDFASFTVPDQYCPRCSLQHKQRLCAARCKLEQPRPSSGPS